jgi:hypothetical protein
LSEEFIQKQAPNSILPCEDGRIQIQTNEWQINLQMMLDKLPSILYVETVKLEENVDEYIVPLLSLCVPLTEIL